PSPKRGLCHVPSQEHPYDDAIWTPSNKSQLTWYYNYKTSPSPSFIPHKDLQFVPMLWGASSSDKADDPSFLDTITAQIARGANITHILSFNEPDGPYATGGSNMPIRLAVDVWKTQIEPLRKLGVKVGAPAVTGSPIGLEWLSTWLEACEGGCTPDFVPVHWYGDFEGLARHVGYVVVRFPGLPVWVTEWGFGEAGLEDTQRMFKMSVALLDRWPAVERYAYFGAFRSDVSNVGPNAAMLTEGGLLTDIGSWYMGGEATHEIP
ncbi:glycoside hydrolase family 128 protein, partial [Periconia macrospinosa]